MPACPDLNERRSRHPDGDATAAGPVGKTD